MYRPTYEVRTAFGKEGYFARTTVAADGITPTGHPQCDHRFDSANNRKSSFYETYRSGPRPKAPPPIDGTLIMKVNKICAAADRKIASRVESLTEDSEGNVLAMRVGVNIGRTFNRTTKFCSIRNVFQVLVQ
ncbi:hypothetical protein HYFRA_00009311 [Hymenoscyphus fraxineus]|uniref:Uncharacterized protein n=1 Tax=Hymenoscyphus fraxineus TaxID=746836 RepID=A0A9N9PVC1_9HELO|nr:hypothetical protein HYFRA_00009311 [Hymenoscyphus fraxineus]